MWTKSSHSAANCSCIEARQHGNVQLRDSKLGDNSPILTFHPTQWAAFVDAVKQGVITR
jgi:hypothetical protein